MTDVVVVREADEAIAAAAKRRKLRVVVGSAVGVEFDRALVVKPGTAVPWDLVGHGFHFVKLWDAAVPLWKYNMLAESQGTAKERKLTEALTLDLRIPIYACELLFVQGNELGFGLLEAWEEEQTRGPDERLAFLRAVARVKPRLCTLPADWLGAMRIRRERPRGRGAEDRELRAKQVGRSARRKGRSGKAPAGLVRVEVGPGRFVLARPENVERVKADYEKRQRRRADRQGEGG